MIEESGEKHILASGSLIGLASINVILRPRHLYRMPSIDQNWESSHCRLIGVLARNYSDEGFKVRVPVY